MLELSSHLQIKQSVVFNAQLKQALHVLQLPIVELAQWLEINIEQKRQDTKIDDFAAEGFEELDFELRDFSRLQHLDESFIEGVFPEEIHDTPPIENIFAASVSLHEHLMSQARMVFLSPEELECAEYIIGNIDQKGFLEDTHVNPNILRTIQTFDPLGIGGKDLRESLLIQLRFFKKESSLIYHIIENFFEDLLKLKFSFVAKKLKMTPPQLRAFLKKEGALLNFHPTARFHSFVASSITPDIIIKQKAQKWVVFINESPLAHSYTKVKWLKKIIEKRNSILQQIGNYILQKQWIFFTNSSFSITPCSMTEAGKTIGLHESTISRAINGKYLDCPKGLLPLRFFFPHCSTEQKKHSPTSDLDAKMVLIKLIKNENRENPLSDQHLAILMKQEGIPCARRTIAKYRQKLRVPSSLYRL